MIPILPRHCIIYDPDSSPSVPYLHEERLFNLTLFFKFRRSGGLRIFKVRVGRNKWCLYFMLFAYGLFRLTRKSEVFVFVKLSMRE